MADYKITKAAIFNFQKKKKTYENAQRFQSDIKKKEKRKKKLVKGDV